MARLVIAIIALAILAVVATSGFQAALETAGEDNTITGETWTPDAGNTTTLDNSNIQGAYYNDTVVVRDENGNLSDAGTDYEWNPGNGTVKALAGGNLDGDTSATIHYAYEATTGEQRRMTGMLAAIPQLLGLVLPIGAVLFLFMVVAG